ncbi:MAG: hypothetical protein ACKVIF_07775 [Rhodospirillales bacterium]
MDVWRYIAPEDIPVINLYFDKNDKRYCSLSCVSYTGSTESAASS